MSNHKNYPSATRFIFIAFAGALLCSCTQSVDGQDSVSSSPSAGLATPETNDLSTATPTATTKPTTLYSAEENLINDAGYTMKVNVTLDGAASSIEVNTQDYPPGQAHIQWTTGSGKVRTENTTAGREAVFPYFVGIEALYNSSRPICDQPDMLPLQFSRPSASFCTHSIGRTSPNTDSFTPGEIKELPLQKTSFGVTTDEKTAPSLVKEIEKGPDTYAVLSDIDASVANEPPCQDPQVAGGRVYIVQVGSTDTPVC
jgi:hypothetical protein